MSRWRRESVTVGLVALVLGAAAAASGSLAADVTDPPPLAHGSAVPNQFAAAELKERQDGGAAAGSPVQPAPPAAPATTVVPTTTEPPPTTTTEPPPPTTEPPPVTTTSPAQPSSPVPAPAVSQADQVVAIVNEHRTRAGCRPVTVDERLTAAAQGHSTDMAVHDYFSHTSRDGSTFADRIRAAGYPNPAAENIAMGQRSATQVMRAWMNSSGHRANILNCRITTIGVGLDTRGWYWTQNFGR